MIISPIALSLAALVGAQSTEAIDIERKFRKGEKHTFQFVSKMTIEFRGVPLETFLPFGVTYSYAYTMETERLKPDGAADVRFKRPNIKIREGETVDSPPKMEVINRPQNLLLTFSRKNQLLTLKDESPKEKKKAGTGGGGGEPAFWSASFGNAQLDVTSWIAELRSLGAFVNFFDWGPVLPVHPVKVGDTWKETVGYVPATLKSGADKGRNIMTRIDYTYVYKGNTTREGKKRAWIQGTLHHDSDAAPFVADLLGIELKFAPFKEIKLQMDATVDYYLDPETFAVYEIEGTSKGNTSITIRGQDGPYYEERFTSEAYLVRK
ncbi:MAG TPA: hypothetical protein VNK96_08695 [Fimbriimonadales bacterium]|nr:hypothetical protein [Fimbriimonadales bacterium]